MFAISRQWASGLRRRQPTGSDTVVLISSSQHANFACSGLLNVLELVTVLIFSEDAEIMRALLVYNFLLLEK
jgi:hypothetical protein